MTRLRPRKYIIVWIGVVTMVLLLLFWAVSHAVRVGHIRSHFMLVLNSGVFTIAWADDVIQPTPVWWAERGGTGASWYWLVPNIHRIRNTLVIQLPLLSLAIIAGLITLLSRRAAREPQPGHCQGCGYNLAGNTTGVCPECGREIG